MRRLGRAPQREHVIANWKGESTVAADVEVSINDEKTIGRCPHRTHVAVRALLGLLSVAALLYTTSRRPADPPIEADAASKMNTGTTRADEEHLSQSGRRPN